MFEELRPTTSLEHVNRRMFTGRGERRATQLATNSNNYAHTYLLVILGRQIIGCEKQGNCGQSWICLFIRCPQNNVVAWKENLSSFCLCLRTWWQPEWGMCSCAPDPDMMTSACLLDTRAVLMHVALSTLPCYDSSLSRQPSLSALGIMF